MGRNWKRARTKGADGAGVWKKERWEEVPMSDDFARYYQAQELVPDDEWPRFQAACETPLPITFRFNANLPAESAIARLRRGDFDAIREAAPNDNIHPRSAISPPSPLSWFGGDRAWKIGATRRQLKKHPHLSELNRWLTTMNENGVISRQEAVSMIPALLLGVECHHAVLDACAAPGSKTAQILESMNVSGGISNGFVIANDASLARANNLTHQLNRLCLPFFVVSHHEAQHFPALKAAQGASLTFDRILCDVPCSGDGTVRKNSEIWAKWSTSQGAALHRLQLQIVQRALQLLRPGGRIVYSTCSFNPIENEAVVAEILRQDNGGVSLVDVSESLPGLIRRPGRHTWKVFEGIVCYSSVSEVPESARKSIRDSMFPPTAEEASRFHLERCLRLMPHDQDTGGFFVAVLIKRSTPAPEQPEPVQTAECLDVDAIRKRLTNRHKNEIVFRISDFPEHTTVLDELVATFGLSGSFPVSQLWCRSSHLVTIGRIYLVNQAVDVIHDVTYHRPGSKSFNIVHSGLLVFENSRRKHPRAPPYRISHTGASFILPFMSKRVWVWPAQRFVALLTEKKADLHEADNPNDEYGSMLIVCDAPNSMLVATCWCTVNAVEVMMNQSAIDCVLWSLPSLSIPPPQ